MAAPDVPNPSVFLHNMDEVKKVFNRFDINGDGKISATELTDVMKTLGSDTSPEEVARMMEEIDTDRDGFINLDEFAGFLKRSDADDAAAAGDAGGKELKEAFELYDLNHNGLISSTELHQILTRLGEKCSVQDCTNMINSVDSDGDGFVNFEEFKKMMTNSAAGGHIFTVFFVKSLGLWHSHMPRERETSIQFFLIITCSTCCTYGRGEGINLCYHLLWVDTIPGLQFRIRSLTLYKSARKLLKVWPMSR